MADTRTIYLHTGIETFSSDPSDSQYIYLDMSDYDNLNPQYQSTIKLSSGVAGIYESTKAKITLTFKGENSGRDARADWVNKYAERINKISVNTTENKSAVFNKSATVSEVEFIDTPYIDGAQVIIEVTMFGRWQSALSTIETVTENYEGGTKTYLGQYSPEILNSITNGDFSNGWSGWSGHDYWNISDISTTPKGSRSAYTQSQDKSLVLDLPFSKGQWVVIKFMVRGDLGGQSFHADLWGGAVSIDELAGSGWKEYTLSGIISDIPQFFIRLVGGGTLFVGDVLVYSYGNLMKGTLAWGNKFNRRGTISAGFDDNGMEIVQTTSTWDSPTYPVKYIKNDGNWLVGKKYTFSTYVNNASSNDIFISAFGDQNNMTGVGDNSRKLIKANSGWVRVSTVITFNNNVSDSVELRWESYSAVSNGYIQFKGYQFEFGEAMRDYGQAIADTQFLIKPHYNYDYSYGTTTLQNQIALPKDRNRFMLAIDSQYSVATITLSANGKRATISTSRLSANSSLSSDFVAYDITAFVDTDKFLLLNSGLVASVVWDNLASQYAVLYQIMNSVGDTPADISVTTTGGQHIPFKLYTYSIQDFI